ncbi:hypothetical protein GCM10025880_04830 [Methylorubrum aminovorans]|nr:hypothetical protein GCM10025880_04830 [Methylorubrum aminovorans]
MTAEIAGLGRCESEDEGGKSRGGEGGKSRGGEGEALHRVASIGDLTLDNAAIRALRATLHSTERKRCPRGDEGLGPDDRLRRID